MHIIIPSKIRLFFVVTFALRPMYLSFISDKAFALSILNMLIYINDDFYIKIIRNIFFNIQEESFMMFFDFLR